MKRQKGEGPMLKTKERVCSRRILKIAWEKERQPTSTEPWNDLLYEDQYSVSDPENNYEGFMSLQEIRAQKDICPIQLKSNPPTHDRWKWVCARNLKLHLMIH